MKTSPEDNNPNTRINNDDRAAPRLNRSQDGIEEKKEDKVGSSLHNDHQHFAQQQKIVKSTPIQPYSSVTTVANIDLAVRAEAPENPKISANTPRPAADQTAIPDPGLALDQTPGLFDETPDPALATKPYLASITIPESTASPPIQSPAQDHLRWIANLQQSQKKQPEPEKAPMTADGMDAIDRSKDTKHKLNTETDISKTKTPLAAAIQTKSRKIVPNENENENEQQQQLGETKEPMFTMEQYFSKPKKQPQQQQPQQQQQQQQQPKKSPRQNNETKKLRHESNLAAKSSGEQKLSEVNSDTATALIAPPDYVHLFARNPKRKSTKNNTHANRNRNLTGMTKKIGQKRVIRVLHGVPESLIIAIKAYIRRIDENNN